MATAWELYKKSGNYYVPEKTKSAAYYEQRYYAQAEARAREEEEERRRQNRAILTQIENEATANRFANVQLTPLTPQGMQERTARNNYYAEVQELEQRSANAQSSIEAYEKMERERTRGRTTFNNAYTEAAEKARSAEKELEEIKKRQKELESTAESLRIPTQSKRGTWLGDVAKSAAKDSTASGLANFASAFAGLEDAYKKLQFNGKTETPDAEKSERDYAAEYLQGEIAKQEWEITKLQKQINALAPEDPQRNKLTRQLRTMYTQLGARKDILARVETYYSEAAYDLAGKLKEESAQDIQKAYEKAEGVPLGKIGTDVAAAGIGMATDLAVGAVTGLTPLTAAAIRAAGSANLEAKSEGASNTSAAVRGALEAVKVSLIGRISNVSGIAQKFSGKTAKLDEIVEAAVAKLAQNASSNPAVQKGLGYLFNALASGAGEGAEEMLETLVDPALDALSRLDWGQMSDYASGEYWGGLLYDGLIGGIMGLAGGALDVGKLRSTGTQEAVSETPKTVSETPKNEAQAPQTVAAEVNTPAGAETAQGAEIQAKAEEYNALVREYQSRLEKARKEGYDAAELKWLQDTEKQLGQMRGELENTEKIAEKVIEGTKAEPKIMRTLDQERALENAKRLAARFGTGFELKRIGNGISGQYSNGKITIDPDAPNPVMQVMVHELTHHMETSGLYNEFSDMIIKYISETLNADVQNLKNRIISDYSGIAELDEAGATRELVAKFCETELFTNEESIERLLRDNRNLFQRIYDWIRGTLARMGAKPETQALMDAEKLYKKALEKASAGNVTENLYAGRNARSANFETLRQAEEMLKAGSSAEEVRQTTGWFKGMDGKWRFEIDDSKAKYRSAGDALMMQNNKNYNEYRTLELRYIREAGSTSWTAEDQKRYDYLREIYRNEPRRLRERVNNGNATLADILEHSELFEAYPELRNAAIKFEEMEEGERGRYSGKKNTIYLNSTLRNKPESTLIHEIQHAIQNAEGFSGGASPFYWASKDAESGVITSKLREEYDAAMRELTAEEVNKYERYKELERELERLEDAEDGTPEAERYVRFDKESDALYLELYNKDWFKKLDNLRQQIDEPNARTYEKAYRNTAGEIEARDAASRRGLNAERRKNTAPNMGDANTVFVDESAVSQARDGEDTEHIKQQLRDAQQKLADMGPVVSVKLSETEWKDKRAVLQWATEYLKATGYQIEKQGVGTITFEPKWLDNGLRYLNDSGEFAAFAAVPRVLKRGVEIGRDINHKGRGLNTVTYGAQVTINGVTGNMAVVVSDSKGLHYKVHRILTPDGKTYELSNKNNAEPTLAGESLQSSSLAAPIGSASNETVSRPVDVVKENSYGKSFRELMAEQKAERNASQQGGDVNSADIKAMERSIDEIRSAYGHGYLGSELVTTEIQKKQSSIKSELGKTARFVYRKMVDAGEAVQRIAKATGDNYLYAYYNMARASTNAAASMITDAQTNITGDEIGKSLNAIFEPIKAKGKDYYKDFETYLFHGVNIDRMGGAREALTRKVTQKLREFEKTHQELMSEFGGDGKKLVEMANDENSPFYADALKLLQLRSALNRAVNLPEKAVFRDEIDAVASENERRRIEKDYPEFPKLAEEVYKYADNLLKYRVDSGLITQEQYETWREMYPHYVPTFREQGEIDAADKVDTREKNKVRTSKVIKTAYGGDTIMLPIDASLARQTYSVVREGAKNRFGQRLLEHSTTDEKGHNRIEETTEYELGFNPEDIDAPREDVWKKNNTFIVYKDGMQVDMTVSPELYEGIKVLAPDQEQSNMILKGASAVNNAYKQLITGLNPTFAVRNFIRDLQDAGLNTKDFAAFAENYPLAIKEIAKNGEYWKKYKALGGTYSTIFDYETGQMQKDSPLKEKTLGKVEAINMAIEQAPRLAEFMATVKKGDGSLDNLMEAMLASADVTTNFGRSGTWGKNLNRYLIPFFNPSVQGLDKFVRVFTEAKGAKQWFGLVGKAAIFGIAPALLNELIYREDDEWDDMRQSDKDTNYMFKIKDGLWLKIPKGRALSIFGMLGGRGVNIAQGDYEDFADFLKTGALTFAETAGTQMAPSNPLQENILRDWFSTKLFNPDSPGETWYGSDIENQRMQNYAPEERYDSKTDEISKWLGKKTGLSPKKINYLLNQYTGVIGDIVLPLLTPAAERDMFSAAFTVDTNYSNELSERFYGKLDELTYAKNKTGSTPADAATLRYWNKVSSSVAEINAAIREIEESKELSEKDKKEKIALLYAERNALERSALNSFDAYAETAEGYYGDWVRPEGLTDEQATKKATDYAYLMANKEILGAEYAIETYDKEIYLTAQNLNSLGVSYEDFFDYYFTAKDLKATKRGNVTVIPEGNKKREYLASMDISDEAKKALYTVFISDSHGDDIYRITTTGLDFNDYLFIQNKYSEINEKNLDAQGKTLEFERWIDSEGFNARQEKAIQDSFKFYSMTQAKTEDKYDELTGLGISADKAEELVKKADAYDMSTSKEKLQFYRLAVSSVSSKKDRLNALTPWLDEGDLARCTYAYEAGIDPAIWVTFKEQMYGKTTQAQAKYVIDGLVGLDQTQRAILWQLADKGWKAGKNPYSVQAGQKVYDFMHQED